jgi:hypothetical protein
VSITTLTQTTVPSPCSPGQKVCEAVDEVWGQCDLVHGHPLSYGHVTRWPGFVAQWAEPGAKLLLPDMVASAAYIV